MPTERNLDIVLKLFQKKLEELGKFERPKNFLLDIINLLVC